MFISKSAQSRGADDDFWFTPLLGGTTAAGVNVTADNAMAQAAVFACVRVIAESVAQLPLIMYRRRADGGKQRAPEHPLYDVLSRRPNEWQTSFEWREMMQGHAALRGVGYSEIIEGRRGFADQLIPLHPDRVKLEILSDTNYRYVITSLDGSERALNRSRMFAIRGISSDGFNPLSPIGLHRETVGMAKAAQDYGARFFANDAKPSGGWIEFSGKFESNEAKRAFRQSWQESMTGANRHKSPVLEHGMKYHEVGMSNRDSQFIEVRKHQDVDIARIFRVPPHKIGILDRATFSNIEQQALEFVTDTLMPWLKRWEQAISRDLIIAEDTFFAEFLVDGLLRGDTKSRYEAYNLATTGGGQGGWMTRNEVRLRENLNPLPGLDDPISPNNATESREAGLVRAAADRIANKELTAVANNYAKRMPDAEDFADWLRDFYAGHVDFVQSNMAIHVEAARNYCQEAYGKVSHALADVIASGGESQAVDRLLAEWKASKSAQLIELR